jgi:hypothetical protein
MLRATLCALLVVAATTLGAQEHKQPQAQRPVEIDVALALVLAVDASGSVSDDRFELQKQGYAAAFRNRQVLNSIRSLTTQSIAVTMMQWTGPELHVQTVDWTLAKDEASVKALADAIEGSNRQLFGGGTSIAARSTIRASFSPPARFSASVASSTSQATAPTIADER